MTPHSNILAWKIPGTEEPGRLQSMRSQRVRQDWATSLSLSRTGEGNGNPLQCSCLENSRDGGAWWAAVYGVAQSWTRLKWLGSSSSKHNSHLYEFRLSRGSWLLRHPPEFSSSPCQSLYPQWSLQTSLTTTTVCPGTIFPPEPVAASSLQGTWARAPAPSLGSHSADFPFDLWLGALWEGKDLVLSVNAFLCNAGLNDYFYSSFYKNIFPQNFYRLIAKHHYPSILTRLPNMHVLQVTMLSRHKPCPACHAPGWWVCLQPSH